MNCAARYDSAICPFVFQMSHASSLRCSRCGAALDQPTASGWCAVCSLGQVLREPGQISHLAVSLGDIPVAGRTQAQIGDYELLELIAQGGMGAVYRARQRSLNRIVALKLLLGGAHAGEDFKKRFRQEAETAAKLHHPNIVPIYEVGVHEGQPYFSMELVAGANLARLTRDKPLPARKAAAYLESLAETMAYAHAQGVVHRDLKPSNILVGADDRPRITDFGLARRLDEDSSLTLSGEMLGTPGYLPPEQATAKRGAAGPHSDVYALGAMLHFLLTGRPPFLAGTLADTLQQVLFSEPVSLRRLNPAIPADLETICLKCLEKEPARRYASAQALAQDLRRFLEGKSILAKPASAPEKVLKWYRREPLIAGLWTATVLVLLLGLSVSTWLLLKQRAETARADEHAAIAQAVKEFMVTDLLRQASTEAQADAGFAPNPDLAVREALRRAAQHVGNRFKDQPLVEAGVRAAIGDAYEGLGEPEHAIPQYERAVELLRSARGRDHLETVEAMDSLAQAYQEAGRIAEALPLFEDGLRVVRTRLGVQHEMTLVAMNNLASAFRQAGKTNEAVALFEETLKLKEATQARDHPDTLTTMGNLAVAYQSNGQLDRAIPLFEETLRLEKIHLSPLHPYTVSTMANLSSAYRAASKLDPAMTLMRETLELQRTNRGVRDFHTQRAMDGLALTCWDAGRRDEAISLFQELLRVRETSLETNHLLTLQSAARLGSAYQMQTNYPEAERHLLRVCNGLIQQPKPGDDSRALLQKAGGKLVELYQAQGKSAEAEDWRRRLADRVKDGK